MKIKVKPLTVENFHIYGDFVDLLNPSGPNLGDFYRDPVHMHVSGRMQMTFSPLTVHKTEKMIVDTVEYHDYTQEASLCLDDDIVLHVAPASDEPIPEQTEAFFVPKGTLVRIHAGVWHYAAMPVNLETAHVLIVLPERTYKNDCTVVEYTDAQKVEIEL